MNNLNPKGTNFKFKPGEVFAYEIHTIKKKLGTFYKTQRKYLENVSEISKTPSNTGLSVQMCQLFFTEENPWKPVLKRACRELVPSDSFHCAQLFRHSDAAMMQRSLALSGIRLWHHPCDGGISSMQNASAVESKRRPSRFQRQAQEGNQEDMKGYYEGFRTYRVWEVFSGKLQTVSRTSPKGRSEMSQWYRFTNYLVLIYHQYMYHIISVELQKIISGITDHFEPYFLYPTLEWECIFYALVPRGYKTCF